MTATPPPREPLGGRYELLEPLGRGGMGTVWRARDRLLGRHVAVKELLPPHGLTAEEQAALQERTHREARAAARLSTTAAVTVYDVLEQDGRPWIVMELLDARSLAERLRDDGPVPAGEAARIGLAVLDALEAAHRAGVVHRDVKPANVMLCHGGRVALTDFGVAALDGDPSLTMTGTVLGSPAYMAPERAQGVPPSPAMDLWSLGATLYAAVEGRSPFQRDGALASLNAVLTEPVPPAPRAGALEPALAALLDKDPDRRADVGTARHLLQQAALAPPPSPAEADTTRALPLPPPETPSAEQVVAVATGAPGGGPALAPGAEEDRRDADRPVPPPVPITDPTPEPVPVSPPVRPTGGRRRARGAVAGVAAVGVLAAAAAVALTRGDDGGQPVGVPTPAPTTTAGAARSPGPTGTGAGPTPGTATGAATATSSPGTSPASSPTAIAAVPVGFEQVRDPSGFSVAVPEGWNRRVAGSRVDYVAADGRRFLRIDQTRQPQDDPKKDWERQEAAVAARLPGYQRISIEDVDYQDWDAADWDFRWQGRNGAIRVRNRNVVTADDRAYALYFSVPDATWGADRAVFEQIAASFRPAG